MQDLKSTVEGTNSSVMAVLFGVALIFAYLAVPTSGMAAAKAKGGKGAIISEYYQGIRKQVLPLIKKVRKKYKVNGLSIALVDGSELVWSEGFGYADIGRKKKATAETIYRIGSISKPFTATAVMQMVEQEIFDLDRPLQEYLPEFNVLSRFQATADNISVRSVLSHHSGLPTDLRKGMWTNDPITTVADHMQGEYLAYPPDMIFNYSNVGYTLLGHMLQEHSGKEFTRHMAKYLFKPLGMGHTDYVIREDMRGLMSRGYRGKTSVKLPAIRDLPAYSMYSTVGDMSRFVRMYLSQGNLDGKSVLEGNSVKEMFRVQNLDVDLDMNIQNGLGWYVENGSVKGAGRVVRHGGATMLFSSEVMLLPDDGLGVIILANTKGSGAVIKKLANRILKYSLKHKRAGNGQQASTDSSIRRKSRAQINHLVPEGKYATALGVLKISPKRNKICICDISRKFTLVPQTGGWYAVPKKNIGKRKLPSGYDILPDIQISSRLVNRREVIVAKRRGKEFLLGERVRDEAIPKKWKKRVGNYKVINPDSGFEMKNTKVAIEQGMLNISYRMPKLSNKIISVPIRPISDTKAIVLGLGRMRGEVLQVVMVKGKECLKYSGYIVRKI